MINDLVETRKGVIDSNVSDEWIWPKTDQGAWYGPMLNWHDGHKDDYFRYVKNYDVVITAGANCGLYTRVYAS